MMMLTHYLQRWVEGYTSQIMDLDIFPIIMTLGSVMLILMLVLYLKNSSRKWYFYLKGLKQIYVQLIALNIIFQGMYTAAFPPYDDVEMLKIGDMFLEGIFYGLFGNMVWLFLSFTISLVLFVFGIICSCRKCQPGTGGSS